MLSWVIGRGILTLVVGLELKQGMYEIFLPTALEIMVN